MRVLEYDGLDITAVAAQYRKVRDAIERDDFRQADLKKLANVGHGKFYRAKLDYSNRLLLTFVRYGGSTYALMLEVIEQHAYEKSRFLRGAAIDEAKIPDTDVASASAEATPVRYLHRERREIHLLDKVISFDDTQEAVYRLAPPLIVVGAAGSGKTALMLEKLKHADGEVLYVTRSAYLAQSARELYFSHGFERPEQEANFLSYREFLETLRVPHGREAGWRDFCGWFARHRQAFKDIDAHQAFEEIRGVITAREDGPLDRERYCALGVRESIFAARERDRVYDLFEKYRAWLAESDLYDLNLVAHTWRPLAAPRYDFVVIDEVQDITNVELALVLATLKHPGHFLLCGDSNQIVHPNFFSWSKVKSLFWRDEALAGKQELKILRANFRNARQATRVANTLLKIKHRRFGSIDRESNFLVESVIGEEGTVSVLADKDGVKRDLNAKTRRSARVAVLVMRDEDKPEARRHFQTPLIFSIHEAKGLEYESIVLYRFISGDRTRYAEIAEGVTASDLEGVELDYRRSRDKSDRSLEIYKFYVNALYVALTRAIRNVYLIESDLDAPLLRLLGIRESAQPGPIAVAASGLDDWQKEARKLELQGKQEQAEAIRHTILRQAPVPWPVFGEAHLRETLAKVFAQGAPGAKHKQQLYEYATCYDEPMLAQWLSVSGFASAAAFERQQTTLGRKHYMPYFAPRIKDVLQQCERHGIDHRTPMDQTPLMAAAAAGNVALVEALLERGADPELTDHLGRNALHWAMIEAFRDPGFARKPFAVLYELIAPAAIDLSSGERLVRIDRHLTEYFLFQTLWVLFKSCFQQWPDHGGFRTAAILHAWKHVPANVLRAERNKRSHLSGVLARNEVGRDYAYNRRLFMRLSQGWYQLNPQLRVRRREAGAERWVPILEALNLHLIAETAHPAYRNEIDALLSRANRPPLPELIIGDEQSRALNRGIKDRDGYREFAQIDASERSLQRAARRARRFPPRPVTADAPIAAADGPEATEADAEVPLADPSPAPATEVSLPWGTKRARLAAIERVRRQIEENAARRNPAVRADPDSDA